ncbi:MAG: hypothetical protein QUS12_00400 [Methanosarcina sp.]|nr:hypothetical protein [Methanosarcina sp.]
MTKKGSGFRAGGESHHGKMGRDFIKSIGRIKKYKIQKFYCGKCGKT